MTADTAIALKTIEKLCEQKALRLTKTRRRVLEMIIAAGGPVKAYDLLDQLQAGAAAERRRIAPPTVYRALDFLLQNHFIHKLESINAYVYCPSPEHHHSGQFLICECCDRVIEVQGDPLDDNVADLARANRFVPERQVVEVYGTCERCRNI